MIEEPKFNSQLKTSDDCLEMQTYVAALKGLAATAKHFHKVDADGTGSFSQVGNGLVYVAYANKKCSDAMANLTKVVATPTVELEKMGFDLLSREDAQDLLNVIQAKAAYTLEVHGTGVIIAPAMVRVTTKTL